MIAPARNPGQMRRALYTVGERRARWQRDEAIRRNPQGLARDALAQLHGLSVSTVRDIQGGRRR